MFMMHLMCPSDRPHIAVFSFSKPFEAAVNDHIMHNKISKSISHDTKTHSLLPPDMLCGPVIDQQHAWYRKYDKEPIVFFKKTMLLLMMITVQIPKKPMHDITM